MESSAVLIKDKMMQGLLADPISPEDKIHGTRGFRASEGKRWTQNGLFHMWALKIHDSGARGLKEAQEN